MLDLGAIQNAVEIALRKELMRAREGGIVNVRGAVSRFLLQEEIAMAARTAVNVAYCFDIKDIPAYATMFPDFLSIKNDEGTLGDTIWDSMISHLTKNAIEKAQNTVLITNMPTSPFDILADIEETIALSSDLGPLNKSAILERCVAACYEEPSVEAYRRVALNAEQLSAICRKMTYELDIADPPRAILSGKIHRRLAEAADQITFLLKSEPVETFEKQMTALAV